MLTELWRQAATKFGDLKFCEIRADLCIEGYPEKNTPTVLIYREGQIVKQLITLRELKGPKTGMDGELQPRPVVCYEDSLLTTWASNRHRTDALGPGRLERK